MSRFVEYSNLPHEADTLLIGEKYADILQFSLKKIGIQPKLIPDNPDVDERLSGHADLSVFHAGGDRIYLAPFLEGTDFHKSLSKLGADVVFPERIQNKTYPNDAQLNACSLGKSLICTPHVTADEIVNYFTNKQGTNLILSRQGYAKCSVCVVDDSSLITADRGIAEAAKSNGLDVLLINAGYIDLPGFSYGFIGGAACRLSDRLMAFTGVLDRHPDKQAILAFIRARGFEPVFLTEKRIFDIGSAIPLTEKQSRN